MQLLVALRYYRTGCYHRVSGDLVGVTDSTACRTIHRVSAALASLKPTFINFPSSNEVAQVQRNFFSIAGFPGVMGAVDGTQVRLWNAPKELASLYGCRKGFTSINVQCVCDPDLKIRNIVARWPGSAHDMRIFTNSTLCQQFEAGQIPGHLLGDHGYGCRSYLMTPFLNPRNQRERSYNAAHIKTRNTIERLYGIWKRRFSCLTRGLRFSPERCATIIVAVAVLHNIAKMQHDENDESDYDSDNDDSPSDDGQDQGTSATTSVGRLNANSRQGAAKRRQIVEGYF